ncbi:MAG: hypothetical protein AB7Q17_12235 [Phycisphaerae bacterium]
MRAARIIAAAALLSALGTGCASGRVGSLYVLDDALVVGEAGSPRTAIWCAGRVSVRRGSPVAVTRGGAWVVLREDAPALHDVRTSEMRSDQRLPLKTIDRRLTALNVRTAESRPIAHEFDSADRQIAGLVVVDDALVGATTERFHVPPAAMPWVYSRYDLPGGPWAPLDREEGRRVLPRGAAKGGFADARRSRSGAAADDAPAADWAGVATFAELKARGLNSGSWGTVDERQAAGRWEVVFTPPGGAPAVLLRQGEFVAPP